MRSGSMKMDDIILTFTDQTSQAETCSHINIVADGQGTTRELGCDKLVVQQAPGIGSNNRTMSCLVEIARQTKDLGFSPPPIPFWINVQNGWAYGGVGRWAG